MDSKFITRSFIRGLFTILPLALSLYFLYWFLQFAEEGSQAIIRLILPDSPHIPGMGIVIGIVIIFVTGVMMANLHIQKLFSIFEVRFIRVPLVKSIYAAIKDLIGYFNPGEKGKKTNQVVLVKLPDSPVEVIGFMTRHDLEGLPEPVEKRDRVAVYIPLSYQIGGVTVFIPKHWVQKLDMSVEEAMRSALTAWMPSESNSATKKIIEK